jgi:predicted dehydrogenase/acetyltransferase-like isoleucine patch superfamily enzyme
MTLVEEKRAATERGATPAIAVVGCGYWGKNLVRVFAELGALAALVDAHRPTVEALTAKHGGRAMSFEAALADPTIDAVAIAAPAALHYSLAKQALKAGKHVFVEKPLALEVAEAQELCELAERLDRRLMVGHLLQYHSAFLKLKELVREGRLGRLQYLYSNRLNLGKIRREEDILWSFAPHDLSMILSLVGSEPVGVTAVGGYYLHHAIADVTTTTLSFAGGERAHVFVSWLHPFKEQKLIVIGDAGMAVFDDTASWDNKLVLYPHRVAWRGTLAEPVRGEPEAIAVPQTEPLKQECQHFLECIVSGATPRTDGREGLRVLRVLSRARASMAKARRAPAAPDSAAPPRVVGDHPGVRIHETAYVDLNVEIGEGTRIWHFSHVLSDSRIGKNGSIGQNVVIGPKVTIGNGAKIQNNVSVYEGVTLEDNVFCGPSCVFTNVNNPRSEIVRKTELRHTLVGRGATIGANATIVCGATLGKYSFIAAGAVVAGDVAAFALMAGVPARRIGWMSRAGGRLGPDLVCPLTGTRYRETGPDTLEEIA